MANDVTEKKNLESDFENFFIRTKYLWIVLICAVAVALAVICTVLAVTSSNSKKASDFLEDAIFNYESALANKPDTEVADIENEFIATLEDYTATKGKNKNTIRVYMTLAKVYMDREDWEKSLENWQNASKCSKSSYLAGISDFNAGVCCEQLGKTETALECYKSAASNKNFHLVPHALFSQARVLENLGKSTDAIEVYSKIIDTYADDEWADLAKSRIILLNAQKAKKTEISVEE